MHRNSELMFEKFAAKFFEGRKNILEIGPDDYPSTFKKKLQLDEDVVWHTLEIDSERGIGNNRPNHIISQDGYHYPIADSVYDLIFSAQVLEHVPDLIGWFHEKKRILKDGGIIIAISPTSWPYHLAPTDCWRIYPDGFAALAKNVGLELIMSEFDSLELNEPLVKKFPKSLIIPGVSYNYVNTDSVLRKKIFINKITGRLGIFKFLQTPVTVSYDCFTVFKKV